ncbi:hypothetical protein [Caldilinea sp.]|jgi:hypothetical protein|uniref:hypothetical protein n=1 Tax=Caldilinea sp. TaxID=2293560 RepID=UPI0026114F0A|nr:hypothetical protein [uncultured Caldilinea sp.]
MKRASWIQRPEAPFCFNLEAVEKEKTFQQSENNLADHQKGCAVDEDFLWKRFFNKLG